MKGLRLYGHYVSIHVKSAMQYKMSFFLTALGQFLVSFSVFLGIYFMFQRFPSVEGFTYEESLLCFGIVLLQFSLAEMAVRGFDQFSSMVRTGEFDRVLVRPRGLVLQVLGSKFEMTRIGRIVQGIVMFGYSLAVADIPLTPARIVTLIFMIIGGVALFSGLFLIYAALCFFTLEGLEFMNVFTDGGREFGRYPIGIYGKRMLQFCTFIIPYALVQYYPFLYLIGRTENTGYVFLPLAAVLFLIPGYLLWRLGVRHYKSTGS
ncbi:MAG: ABC-2 family transporter protein [Lachnospiraceae bacterium]|nr:ABC-2 family transporter protein [Lachnospiraceae bacterium]